MDAVKLPMDAVKLLKDDHDKVKKILNDLDATTERGVKTRRELFAKVKRELEVHETIEEEIFYPALKEHPKAKDLVLEAFEEHHVVDTVMAENVEHHIEEEEGEMFPQARRLFSKEELEELGDRMQARKERLLEQSQQLSA
jgi:hemerythrin-like domain-containing protein